MLPLSLKLHSICAAILSATFLLAVGASQSWACVISTPTGLSPGSAFRIAFLTTGLTNATATDIGYYNTFVASDAAGYTYGGQSITWKAIVSTATVAARDNIGGFGTSVPVYLVDGTKIANNLTSDENGGFWGGSLLSPLNRQINGSIPSQTDPFSGPAARAWTGTFFDGNINSFAPLGGLGTQPGGYGRFDSLDDDWTEFTTQSKVESSRLYAISETLTVANNSAVPEPTSMAIFGLGALGLAYRARRKSKA